MGKQRAGGKGGRPGAARRLPVGAEPARGGVHFRVWAPKRRRIAVAFDGAGDARVPLEAEGGGWFGGHVAGVGAGARYRFALDDEPALLPDPASRFQPEGPHGPSQVVDPDAFRWSDDGWRGVARERLVVYELHVGTFTREGTWRAAAEQLAELARFGVTAVELLPVADFPGEFGWGYDGVNPFAPTRLYGQPDDMRAFVDRAHAHGVAVLLDVVYNHLGPDGNYLGSFSDHYFTDRYETDWGWPFDLDGPHAGPVRGYILANVEHWIREYHLDGFRLDATQSIFDASEPHIVAEIATRARECAGERTIFVVAENEPQQTDNVRPRAAGGYGLDAVWNDDWHHAARVALTGRREAYYADYRGAPQEFVSAAKYGYLYQGQRYAWQDQRRGTPGLDLPPLAFVHYLENHDQVANSAQGERLHRLTSAAELRAMTTLLLLGPQIPMLFQGQEFASSAPFLYFAEHVPALAKDVDRGRAEFMAQFDSIARPEVRRRLARPSSRETFERCVLDFGERETNATWLALHRDLLALRRDDAPLSAEGGARIDGGVLGRRVFALRRIGDGDDDARDRLLVVNLGDELSLEPAPEPLIAPPADAAWRVLWYSEHPDYGGAGAPPPERPDGGWRIAARCAFLLAPAERPPAKPAKEST